MRRWLSWLVVWRPDFGPSTLPPMAKGKRPSSVQRLATNLLALGASTFGGCSGVTNPSFPLSIPEAERALAEMGADPRPLDRPLVIIGGFADPGFATAALRRGLGPCFADDFILTVDLGGVESLDQARERVVGAVLETYPDPGGAGWQSAEIDIVGNSMGGLVAIDATRDVAGRGRLRPVRVFTIGTPFRGAATAEILPVNDLVRQLKPGSASLAAIDAAACGDLFQLVPYVRSDDAFVGAANASPSCRAAWWVPGEFMASGHMTSFADPRIHADIARRLRGEAPFTLEPPAPLPTTE